MGLARIIRAIRRGGRRNEGTAAVEFALILPLMALLLFGTIDIGRLLVDFHLVSKSVRDATRYLTRVNGLILWSDSDACTINGGSVAVTEAKNLAMRGTIDTSGSFLLGYWINAATIDVTGVKTDNLGRTYLGLLDKDTICSVVMTANVPFNFMNGYFFGHDGTLTLTATHKEAHFGQ